MDLVLTTIFVMASIALVWPHLIYPPLLFLISRLRRPRSPGTARPSVTLVISAFNEHEIIEEKIQNTLALDYPTAMLEIMVISDASDDGTDAVVRRYQQQDGRVKLCRQEERQGKSAGLSRFCPEANGDVLVFTDANSMFRPDAISLLVRGFDDDTVGYTVGSQLYELTDEGPSSDSENIYWNLELRLKEWESRLSSVVGADGAIYALRKEHFEPLAAEDINDFLLPLKVIAKGHRGIFEPRAVCYEKAAPDFRGEFRRKYRIVNRSMRAVLKVPEVCNPLRVGWFAFLLISHKLLRWLGPVFLGLMLVTSAWLAKEESSGLKGRHWFTVLFGLQCAGYALAGSYWMPPLRRVRLVYIAYYFLLVNVAAGLGIGLLLMGRTIGVWKPQR